VIGNYESAQTLLGGEDTTMSAGLLKGIMVTGKTAGNGQKTERCSSRRKGGLVLGSWELPSKEKQCGPCSEHREMKDGSGAGEKRGGQEQTDSGTYQ